jgi:hypothetical protein
LAAPLGVSPQCALQRHTEEMGACRSCACGCHAGKVHITPDVIHVARAVGDRARQRIAAETARTIQPVPLPGRLKTVRHPNTEGAP